MKKFVSMLLVMLCIVISITVTACGKNPNGQVIDPDTLDLTVDPNVSATLNVAIMNEAGEISAFEKIEEGFNELYPNVKLKLQKITNYEQTIMGDVSAGIVYDLMWVSDQYVTLFAEENLIENLDPFIQKSGFDTSLYHDSVIKLGKLQHKGSQYFLPRDINKIVVYINKSIFEQAGVAIPDNDWTWDEFLQTCKALYEGGCNYNANKQFAVEVDYDWRILTHSFSSSFGGTIVDAEGNAVLDEGFQMGLKEMHKLIENEYSTYGAGVQQNFVSGRTAMRFQTRPYAQSYYAALGDDLEAVAFPKIISGIEGTNPSCGAGATGYGICKQSEQKVLAWKLLEYIMSEDGQEKMSESGGIVPSMKSLTNSATATWKSILPIDSEAFVYGGTTDVIYDFYDMLDSTMMVGYDGAIQNMLTKYFMDKNADLANYVKTCRRDITTFVRDQG